MSERIALLGAGALAREYIGIFGRTPFSVAYVDAAYAGGRSEVSGVPIETEWDKVAAHADHYVLAVADQDARAAMRARARTGLAPVHPADPPDELSVAQHARGCGDDRHGLRRHR